MPTFKPTAFFHSRATAFVAACLAVTWFGCGWVKADDLAQRESSRRRAELEEGRMLLSKGDAAYESGQFDQAVAAYSGARDMIPNVPLSAELHRAATDRLAQASIEQSKRLSRLGDVAAAKQVMDKVLADGVAPDHSQARAFRAQLDDPIRTNPALTAQHARNVDEVRRFLYTAQGAYDLGKFDEAERHYQSALRIDPTNTAVRRGMERVAEAKRSYSVSAHDQTRSEMLSAVGAHWELQVPAPDGFIAPIDTFSTTGSLGGVTIATKLERIIIPKISLNQSTLQEAIDLIRALAAENDSTELDPTRRGLNFNINLGPETSPEAQRIRGVRFDLQLTQVPLVTVLKYLTDMTRTSYQLDEYSVTIGPLGSTNNELIARTFRVPPDFLTNLSSGTSTEAAEPDPFATAPTGGGLLTTRMSAKEALMRQVPFPEGASAVYNASNSTLRVVNTASNLDIISQIVQTLSQTEPLMISVKVTMIRTQKTNLEELGFDWLINPFALNSEGSVFGSGGTVGNSPGRTAGDFTGPLAASATDPSTVVGNGVLTNGLRSGDQAIVPRSIDNYVNNLDRNQQSSSVAPGIMSLTGLFTDGEVSMIMRGLSQKKSVDVMSQPSTVTRSGQSASIMTVREFIYPESYEAPEVPTSTSNNGIAPITPANPTDFVKKDVGIVMEVLPVADANKRYVDITLNPSLTEFDGFVNYGSPINSYVPGGLLGTLPGGGVSGSLIELTQNAILMPIFTVQKATTQVTILDGATMAIGGLLSDRIQEVEDKVPVLGDLPWVGRLFKSTSFQPTSTAIIFLVRVELMDPTGKPYRSR